MLDFVRPVVETAVRHGLGAGGAILASKGLADAAMIEALVGGGMAVFAVVWSLLNGAANAKARKG